MKKNHALERGYAPPSLTKLLKIMKLTSFFLIIGALSVKAGGFSQDVKLSLTLNGVKLTTFFKVIEKETDYRFAYCNDIIPEGRIVSVNARKKPLSEIMNEVMAFTKLKYRFDESSGIFIISEKNQLLNVNADKAPLFVKTIRGNVMNERGEPLAGVSV